MCVFIQVQVEVPVLLEKAAWWSRAKQVVYRILEYQDIFWALQTFMQVLLNIMPCNGAASKCCSLVPKHCIVTKCQVQT